MLEETKSFFLAGRLWLSCLRHLSALHSAILEGEVPIADHHHGRGTQEVSPTEGVR